MAILARNALEIIMVGTTHVVDLNGKSAFIYYETDRRAHMRLPDGTTYHGQWELLDEGYRVEWTNGPAGTWKLDHQPGVIDYIDNTGAARGRVTRIDFADTADLAA